jgi:predicted permease
VHNLALLVLCFAAGVMLRRSGRVPENGHAALNAVIIHLSLPALILLHLQRAPLGADVFAAAAIAWALFGLAAVFFLAAGRVMRLAPGTVGALTLTAGLANTSFVGIPMIEAFYGRGGVALGLIIDQLGSYLALATMGILVAALYAGGKPCPRALARRIATFPPLIAVVAAFALRPFEYPDWLTAVLARLGDTLAPLALASVGMQLRLADANGYRVKLALGLAFKLVLAPAVLVAAWAAAFSIDGMHTRIILFEAAMAPMIGGAIVAAEHKLDPPLTALMVGVGIPLSFLTVPAWWWVLERL